MPGGGRRTSRFAFAVIMVSLLFLAGRGATTARSGTDLVRWEPAEPVQGTLFVVFVAGAEDVEEAEGVERVLQQATGSAAGEPLHFQREEDGTLWALAAAPLDRGTSLQLNVELVYDDDSRRAVNATVPIGRGTYELERLTVAPQFAAPPDPAVVERQARERAKAAAVSRLAHETPRLWDEVVLPREARITSGFGNGREFNGKVQSRHTGVDFAGAVGAPVHAAAAGVVALVDDFHLAGNVIYINHGAGLVTGYFHLSEMLVSEGDEVNAGDLIGRVGATGRVTGPHLHWLVRYGMISVDGLSLLELAR